MIVVITDSFEKKSYKIKQINIDDIIQLIKKYPNTKNLIEIDHIGNSIIIKGYLLGKSIRTLLLFQNSKDKIIPVSIIKKTSYKGKNITKRNYFDLFGMDIDKAINDIDNGSYQEFYL